MVQFQASSHLISRSMHRSTRQCNLISQEGMKDKHHTRIHGDTFFLFCQMPNFDGSGESALNEKLVGT